MSDTISTKSTKPAVILETEELQRYQRILTFTGSNFPGRLSLERQDGDGAWQGSIFYVYANRNDFIIPNGNVGIGIGTATPAAKLDVNGSARIAVDVGFYGTTPQAKQTVTGSRGGNAALTSLLTALATIGLITNNTTA